MEDIKELTEFMESEEGKTAVSGWLKESGFRSADDITGLEHKKDELLGKVAKSQADKKVLNELYKKYPAIQRAVSKIPRRKTPTPPWEKNAPQRLITLMETIITKFNTRSII